MASAFLQNTMTGAIDEFPSEAEAFEAQLLRNKREHWSLYRERPEPFEPKSAEPYEIEAVEGPGIGTYERQEICAREIARQRMAALDDTLARVSASRDIVQFIAAE